MGNAAAAGRRSGNNAEGEAAAGSRWQGGKVKVARPRRRRGVEEEVEQQRRRAGGGGGGVVMTVKVLMTRKEAEKLIARLDEQRARERKARMAELTGRLRTGDGVGGSGGRSPVAAWAPSLRQIHEN